MVETWSDVREFGDDILGDVDVGRHGNGNGNGKSL